MFLRNHWYVAASGSEIGRKPFRRIIMNEPVVFYRTEDGTPVALEDRCPHRRLPLSMGKLVGDDVLQCHYHGLRFDRTGACVRVPGQDMIPQTARVKTYPVVERYKWLWIWMGDPALADPGQDHRLPLARRSGLGRQARLSPRRVQLAARQRQPARPHASCLRARDHHRQHGAGRARRGAGEAHAGRRAGDALDHRPAGAADLRQGRQLHRQRRPLADHRLSCRRRSCASTSARRRPAPARPRARRVNGIQMRNLNAITPETETTTHYFWGAGARLRAAQRRR